MANQFGQNAVEQLFKEIEALKTIGDYENIMCMLGWAMPEKTPCLVFEIANFDLLHYLSEFQTKAVEQVLYKEFLSILLQVIRGNLNI
uniref:Serine-threonine/tyrosine-protein kinase catalytic domain-containing protein n=1 Tax=Acrobeloides nanus TaxID=290746 RepID=A0A914DIU7_9BILA